MLNVNESNSLPEDLSDEEAADIMELCRSDPEWFVREILGGDPWSGQVEIMEAIRDHKEVAVKSCHSAGKDWICGRIAIWFTFCMDPSLVITTGPTDRQVRGILWKEIAIAYKRARVELGGTLLKQELRLDADRWAIGFTTSDDPERFAGFHRLYVLVIIDEASGIKAAIYEAIAGVLSSANSYKLEIGNPNNPGGPFAQSFKTPGVKKITITVFDTPNFTAFGLTLEDMVDGTWREKVGEAPLPRPELVTPEWVDARIKRWGVNNPLFRARVLAEFPKAGENTLIPLHHIEAAQIRTLEPGLPNVIGVDVARFGSNMTVIAHRQGPVLRIAEAYSKASTMETVGYVRLARIRLEAEAEIVDAIGVGAGVVDRLKEFKREPVLEANAASSPNDKEQFLNARAEWYWRLREEFEAGNMDLDPLDEDLAAQLSDIRWKIMKGKIVIESKEDMLKRNAASPDHADAAAHTFAGENEIVDKYKKAMENLS